MPEEKFPWDSLFRGGGGGEGELPSIFRRKDGKKPGDGFKERWGRIKPRTKWIVGIIIVVLVVLAMVTVALLPLAERAVDFFPAADVAFVLFVFLALGPDFALPDLVDFAVPVDFLLAATSLLLASV
mgnify:CR=1 FL=1